MSPADLTERRNQSIKRYHDREEERFKESQQKRLAQDSHTVHEQMKVDDQKRKFIKQA
jgi:hypothetical protein